MKDLKYLFAYTIPLAAYVSFSSSGLGTFAAVIYAFVVIPFFDVIFGQNDTNLSDTQQKSKAVNQLFDWMLYLNLPIVFGLLSYCLFQVSTPILHNFGVGWFISICRNIIGNQRHQCCTRTRSSAIF